MRTSDQLMGLGGSRRIRPAVKCVLLHMIVISGLFLMPGGCPPGGESAILTVMTTGQGSVARDPDSVTYDLNTQVTLTATPEAGWAFDHWEDGLTGTANPATITMDANKSVTAVFAELVVATEWTETDITADTTIPAGNYLVNDSITVHNGATLTIAPGTTLQFADGEWLYVDSDGALYAAGTATSPIVLTGQTKSSGWWIGVRFDNSNSTDNVLQHVTIEYAGYDIYGVDANLYIEGTSKVSVSHCTLRHGSGTGFEFYGNPTITFDTNTITSNALGAGRVEPWQLGVLTTTSNYTGNTDDVLWVRNGESTVDQTWSNLGVDYMMEGNLVVTKHTTLAAGVRMLFGSGRWLYVENTGSLTANGTAGNPIVLTGQTQNPGFWIGVRFDDSNSTDNVLQHVTIEYAGYDIYGVNANLYIEGASKVSVSQCTLRHGAGTGFEFYGNPTITFDTNTVTNNALGAGRVEPWQLGVLTTTSNYTGNTEDVLWVRNGESTVDQTWSNLGVDYMMEGNLVVTKHTTLAAGVRMLFDSNRWLYVENTGSLTANGTSGNPVVLTSQTQNAGFWIGVRFDDSNSANNVLQYVTIEYAGHDIYGVAANLFTDGTSQVTLTNCTIRHSSGYGLWEDTGSTLTHSGTTFASNASGNEHP